MDRLLTDAERKRFATWLEEDAASSRLIAGQLRKIPGMEPFARHKEIEAASEELIARKLRAIESVTIR